MKKTDKKTVFLLNLAFLIYSLTSVMSKFAAAEDMLSVKWILYYGLMLFLLMIYAVLWQFVLKKTDLIIAYSNKAIVVIWGMLWGILFFHEHISLLKGIGIFIIVAGIVVLSKGENDA